MARLNGASAVYGDMVFPKVLVAIGIPRYARDFKKEIISS
jgi:hypothetical protein